MAIVGAVGCSARAEVDERGLIRLGDLTLDWLLGADDKWHVPASDVGVRSTRIGPGPVYETRVRVPGGDAIQRVYAASGIGAPIVVEIENDSPAPFAVAFVLRSQGRHGSCTLDLDGANVLVDDVIVLALPREPKITATAVGSTREVVIAGDAATEFTPVTGSPVEGSFLFPVTHRTRLRCALVDDAVVAVNELPSPEDVQRGWDRQLDRGMRAELPEPLHDRVEMARADLLLAVPSAAVAVVLEDWGFDAEFEAVWSGLGLFARRAARKREPIPNPWRAMHSAGDDLAFLRAVRALLVDEAEGHVSVLPGFPPNWRGADLAVHDIPLRSGGMLSYALRWHGDRPALLWDAPAGVELRAPVLAPDWRAAGGVGEAMVS